MATDRQLIAQIDSLQRSNRNFRQKVAEKAEKALDMGAVVAGGPVAGLIDGKWGNKEVANVPVTALVGGTLAAVGFAGLAGKASAPLGFFGASMASYELGKMVEAKVSEGSTAGVGARSPRALPRQRPISVADLRRHYATRAA